MKNGRFRQFITQSLAGFGSLAMAILFFFALYKLNVIYQAFSRLAGIMMPMIYGAVIAFILTPLCNHVHDWLEVILSKSKIKISHQETIIKSLSVVITISLALTVVYLLLVMVLPQLFESILTLINNTPVFSERVVNWVERTLATNEELQARVLELYDMVGSYLMDWVQNTFLPQIQTMISGFSVGILGILVVLKNLLIGIIISVYLMFNRKLYSAQAKKLIYSLFSAKWANRILMLGREVGSVFSGFIVGKLLDSMIIGLLCFVVMSVFNWPYTLLISTIVGVTNIIPYFGPFIGAFPSALLVLTVSPVKCVYFLVFILILQQVDGNIIGPKILSNSTGLSSFWVLFSLLLFGGLFGIVGMLIGVPFFAVVYDLAQRGTRYLLAKKSLPLDSRDYHQLASVDEDTGQVVLKEKEEKGM